VPGGRAGPPGPTGRCRPTWANRPVPPPGRAAWADGPVPGGRVAWAGRPGLAARLGRPGHGPGQASLAGRAEDPARRTPAPRTPASRQQHAGQQRKAAQHRRRVRAPSGPDRASSGPDQAASGPDRSRGPAWARGGSPAAGSGGQLGHPAGKAEEGRTTGRTPGSAGSPVPCLRLRRKQLATQDVSRRLAYPLALLPGVQQEL
jgi:hypothetical protein